MPPHYYYRRAAKGRKLEGILSYTGCTLIVHVKLELPEIQLHKNTMFVPSTGTLSHKTHFLTGAIKIITIETYTLPCVYNVVWRDGLTWTSRMHACVCMYLCLFSLPRTCKLQYVCV